MTNQHDMSEPVRLSKARLVAAMLAAGGLLTALVTAAWAIARCVHLSRTSTLSSLDFFATAAWVLAGAAGGLWLWGMAEVLRKLEGLLAALRDTGRASANDATLMGVPFRPDAASKPAADVNAALQELVALMREVRDISLLSERDRAARVQIQGSHLVRQLKEQVPALLHEHKWVDAFRRVRQARERFPGFAEWGELEKEIEAVRASVEARDVESATRQVDDLSALGALDRALGVVRELLERHPSSPKALELARRVTIQREKADAEQRAQLMSQAQAAVNAREWNQALTLANELIRRYPKSAEAEALRQQLPTLLENAEIQTRHQMEDHFRELVKQHRLDEAIRLARELLERYPNSPQAQVLREQLPLLEERAALR